MVKFSCLFVLVLSIWCAPVMFSQSVELFEDANAAYEAKDYEKAIELYGKILESGKQSSELHYNLGNAYYNNNQVPQSILQYERALKLSPKDKNINTNIGIAKSELEAPVIPIPDFFLLRFWRGLSSLLSASGWIMMQFIMGVFFLLGIYVWRFKRDPNQKLKGFGLMLCTLTLMILTYFTGSTAHYLNEERQAGILLKENDLRSGPDDASEVIDALLPGTKVNILDQIDDWYKVSLDNKEHGWLTKAGVEVI